jgi:hypothetical protein
MKECKFSNAFETVEEAYADACLYLSYLGTP